jgi:hypothetical protein
MKTNILKIKGDWEEVVNDCRATVKKQPLGHEPSRAFRKKILIAEHSPIRDIIVKFSWLGIPYWVAMHWKTHHWESRVDSQRNDRQSRYDREEAPQKAPVDFFGDCNAQHLIDTWRKRLCFMASPETRGYAEDFKRVLYEREPDIASVLVPNCVYRCGCPEMQTCGWYDAAVRKCPELASTDIQTRYDAYNRVFGGVGDEID